MINPFFDCNLSKKIIETQIYSTSMFSNFHGSVIVCFGF